MKHSQKLTMGIAILTLSLILVKPASAQFLLGQCVSFHEDVTLIDATNKKCRLRFMSIYNTNHYSTTARVMAKNFPPFNALETESQIPKRVTVMLNETGRDFPAYSRTKTIDVRKPLERWPWLQLPRDDVTFTGLEPGGYYAIEVYNDDGLMHRMCLRLPFDPNG